MAGTIDRRGPPRIQSILNFSLKKVRQALKLPAWCPRNSSHGDPAADLNRGGVQGLNVVALRHSSVVAQRFRGVTDSPNLK
jgi:hypothetical protein